MSTTTIRLSPAERDQARGELLRYLEWRANGMGRPGGTPAGFVYRNDEAFVFKHGRFYRSQPLPAGYARMPRGRCFHNAMETVAMSAGLLTYVEGWSIGIAPVHHAFAIDAEGSVVDQTWDQPEACIHHGVAFRRDYLLTHLKAGGMRSILYDYEQGYPILRDGFDVASAVEFGTWGEP
ncbi:MAG: hypothetical protein ACK53W_12520 [Gemmatimonadota bacterium]